MNKDKRKLSLFGIIGYPLTHTMSPYLHNYVFEKMDLNCGYFPFEVKPEDLEKAIQGARSLNINGLNVTVPFKRKVIPYLDQISEEASQIGAVNTIKNQRGALKGYNTDVLGFSRTLKKINFNLEKSKAIVLGAGGGARAVIYSLIRKDIYKIAIYNRTLTHARKLAQKMGKKLGFSKFACHSLDKTDKLREDLAKAKLLVNATPVGMWPDPDKSPLPDGVQLNGHLIVFDLIYNPPTTKLLQGAKAKGATTINGLDMLIYQGVEALNIWLKKEINSNLFPDLRNYLIEVLANGSA